jgi:N-acetylglucosaminyldiphosphoundecaprenol N-acetyl-beta-D-mannosaminyltransferase
MRPRTEFLAALAGRSLTTMPQLVEVISAGGPSRITTINLQHLAIASKSAEFAETIRTADHVTADGWPIVVAFNRLGASVQRVTGSDFIEELSAGRVPGISRVALLGSASHVGDAFEARLLEHNIKLVLRDHGLVADWDPDRVVAAAYEHDAELILISISLPQADLFAAALQNAGYPGTILNVGGALDLLVGEKRRAPRLVSLLGLEWLFRLAQEPRRLFRRYIIEGMPIFATQIAPLLLNRRTRPRGEERQ